VEDINGIALALSVTRNVVPGDWARLTATPAEIWEMLQSPSGLSNLGACLGHDVGPVAWGAFDEQRKRAERCSARVLSRWDAAYPWRLRLVASPPPLLFVRGAASLFELPAFAIVGTRAPSSAGVAFTTRLARDLATRGVVVVSGMARGIDTAAHRGALDAAAPTIAVLGTGVDVAYPPENTGLMERIIASGIVVSEQWCGTIAAPHVFPRRNRIISGVSEGVVVVEGGVKSGALITARCALEQGRDVGAVPGFPGDFRSAGPNGLIKDGAFVVESAGDVIANVPNLIPRRMDSTPPVGVVVTTDCLDDASRRVYDLLGRDADVDDVARASGLDAGRVQEILSRLEIEGLVVRAESGRFARA